jgi:hypothetical protein
MPGQPVQSILAVGDDRVRVTAGAIGYHRPQRRDLALDQASALGG